MTDKIVTEAMKPCPFCGSADIATEDNGHAEWLRCNQCGATGPWIEPPEGHYFTGTELHDQWNTRTTAQEPALDDDEEWLRTENARLLALLNTPEVDDWAKGAILEAAHQRERWGADHDEGKTPFDWFWLVGYLAQKAAASAVAGDTEKAKHHTISTGAALANWHLALRGADTRMVPGAPLPIISQGDGA